MRPDKNNPNQSQVPERLGQEEETEGETEEEEDTSSAGGSSPGWSDEGCSALGEEEGVDYDWRWCHRREHMVFVRRKKNENDQ